jgi:hypothetical protein
MVSLKPERVKNVKRSQWVSHRMDEGGHYKNFVVAATRTTIAATVVGGIGAALRIMAALVAADSPAAVAVVVLTAGKREAAEGAAGADTTSCSIAMINLYCTVYTVL